MSKVKVSQIGKELGDYVSHYLLHCTAAFILKHVYKPVAELVTRMSILESIVFLILAMSLPSHFFSGHLQ